MATTSNFGWTTPDDTDLVKDGALAIRTLGNNIDTSLVDLKGGTTGQILSKNSNTDLDYTWINNDQGDITEVQAGTGISVASGTGPIPVVTNTVATTFDAKGDLVAGTGADTFAKLTVGANNRILTADSGETTGLRWALPNGAAFIGTTTFSSVTSVSAPDNTFTSTYDSYLIIGTATFANADFVALRLRASGSDASGSNYVNGRLRIAANGTITGFGGTQTSVNFIADNDATKAQFLIYVSGPQLAENTVFTYQSCTSEFLSGKTRHSLTTSYDSFTILSGNTNNFSGNFQVYGLAK